MKFKVGDRVKFIGKTTEHKSYGNDLEADIKKYNNVFTIAYISEGYAEFEENRCWCIQENEIELVQEKQFRKADLKNGDIVTYRNGAKRTVIAKKLINSCGCIVKELDDYTDELKDRILGIDLDIVKIEKPVKYETVFERKEEILDETEKRYLGNIIRPFKDKVKYVEKHKSLSHTEKEYLIIRMIDDDDISFPYFEKGTMYKGMEENKRYTLKELCL